jgi:CRP-like cAMP-binding protein/Fe-S-cluster-containing hydrogenase component 2
MGHRPAPPSTANLVLPAAKAAAQQRSAHLAILGSLTTLQHVPTDELEQLLEVCTLRAFFTGQTILSEYKPSEYLCLVLYGRVRLSLHDKDNHEVLLGILERGECFSEGALFGEFFRRVGAVAEMRCYLLQFPLASIKTLLPTLPTVSSALRHVYMHRLADCTLARVPLFSNLSPLDRLSLTGLLKPGHYSRGATILQQGDTPRALYLIEAGQVVVERDRRIIAYLDEGDFIGEMALLTAQPHSATARAITPVDVLVMPASEFQHFVEQCPELEAHLKQIAAQRRVASAALGEDGNRMRQLSQIVEQGLLRGTHLFVRDVSRCPPDCRICEAACAARHGRPRLHIDGLMLADLRVVDTCRQCRVGAECAEVCPENAFQWDDDGALVITDTCTGCGECIPACPYDAISRVPRQQPVFHSFAWLRQHIGRLLVRPNPIDDVSLLSTHRADKCDMCHGYHDMACLSQCPSGALRRVPIEEIFPM